MNYSVDEWLRYGRERHEQLIKEAEEARYWNTIKPTWHFLSLRQVGERIWAGFSRALSTMLKNHRIIRRGTQKNLGRPTYV